MSNSCNFAIDRVTFLAAMREISLLNYTQDASNLLCGGVRLDKKERYSIDTEIRFQGLKLIDISSLIETSHKDWQNFSLCEVNDCVVRLGVIHGEFHWHRHDEEDEFFYVIDGLLQIDMNSRSVDLAPGQAFLIPKGVLHRTRAPKRTSILMMEGKTVDPTGDD
jgi:mannose-6-phosphate isomerase-like protein (cupin superfamily)